MLIAQIDSGEVTQVIDAPTGPGYEDGAWRDFSDPAVLAEWMDEYGWVEVIGPGEKPEDTDTHRHVRAVTYADGRVEASWEQVERTPEEIAARAEAEARFTDLEARVAALEAVVMAGAVPDDPADPDVPTWADLSPAGWWYPDTLLRDVDGTVYRNTSGTVLTTPPSGFPGDPGQWAHLFVPAGPQPDPDPDPTHPEGYVGPWSAQTTYKVGDVCDRAGRYYRCKVAHGPEYQGTWGPPQESVWDDLGATTA